MVPRFPGRMITCSLEGGVLERFTSVPQMPATSIFRSAPSAGMSGIGYSRISVLLGPTRTAASTGSIRSPLLTSRQVNIMAHTSRLLRRVRVERPRPSHDRPHCLSTLLLRDPAGVPLSGLQIDGQTRADETAAPPAPALL